jgi:hypothetical protein
MTFLAPLLLWGLPLAALPIIIHLIHLHRRRTVPWAAMMFLLAAQRMNKGFSKLRQWLILAFRVLAVAALIFVVTRPLAGGWLGLTGGVPDTVLILLDRSASMEQQNPITGMSKRRTGLEKLTSAIQQAYGRNTRLVLIDSATGEPTLLNKADALLDLPAASATDTAADVPALLQTALDHITANKSGRTDVWLLSDLRQTDWDAGSGRWEALRGAFGTMKAVRFHLLSYPQLPSDNLAVTVERVTRRETSDRAELLLDVRVARREPGAEMEVPLRFTVNGATTTHNAALRDTQLVLQGHSLPIDKATKRGWGRVELPGDAHAPDNVSYFVFDESPVLRSVIVSDDATDATLFKAALDAPADPTRRYASTVVPTSRAAEIPWEDAALVVWHAPIPSEEDVLAKQLQGHVANGRSVLFLPPEQINDRALFGLKWGTWHTAPAGKPETVQWWRNDTGLLANARDGNALPVGDLELVRRCAVLGDGIPLARVSENEPLLVKAAGEHSGSAWMLGTLPGPSSSTLARDGVVFFAMLHRALQTGGTGLGKAQQRAAARDALGTDHSIRWQRADAKQDQPTFDAALHAGVLTAGEKLVALNRPASEDRMETLGNTTLDELFAGLDYRKLEDTLEDEDSLVSEVWRTFLIVMALLLIGEALLCMPGKREQTAEKNEKGQKGGLAEGA